MDLFLPLKGEYFDQIKAGTKTEEYRLVNDYWRSRLYMKQYDRIVLTRGYPKRDDLERRLILPYRGYEVKKSLTSIFALRQFGFRHPRVSGRIMKSSKQAAPNIIPNLLTHGFIAVASVHGAP